MPNEIETQRTVPFHVEQHLCQQESKILTTARLPENKSRDSILSQLIAHSHAEDLFDIHDVYQAHFAGKEGRSTNAAAHRSLKEQAHQLKLLALQTLSTLLAPATSSH